MARIVALTNQKGGVGKTTTAINLAASLAALERSVLIVDFDPQANTSSGLGFDKKAGHPGVYHWLTGQVGLGEILRTSPDLPLLSFAPAQRDLVGLEVELVDAADREYRLRDALARELPAGIEYVFIDCPPSLGLLTINALAAADSVLIPIQCEYLALEGVSDLLVTLERVREGVNPGLAIEGVVLTMYDERINLSRQVVQDIRGYFQDKVFETVIPRNIRLAEAPGYGKPILAYDVKSRGSESYLSLAKEVITKSPRR